MSRYKRACSSFAQAGYWSCEWLTSSPGYECTTLWTPHGLARLWRFTGRNGTAGLYFIWRGRRYRVEFSSCPTRGGLKRMARPEIERIVKENP